jgi:hypothetical protein
VFGLNLEMISEIGIPAGFSRSIYFPVHAHPYFVFVQGPSYAAQCTKSNKSLLANS